MIIFLYGQDSYRLNKEAKSIIEKYSKKHPSGVNLFSFDLESDSTRNLKDAIKTVSFFDEVRLIVIKNAFLAKDSDCLYGLIREYELVNNKDVVLLVKEYFSEKDILLKNKKLFNLLIEDKNLVRNFKNLKDAKLESWVRKEFTERNCNVSPVLVRKLIQTAGENAINLSCEIDKLSNFKLKGDISDNDIELLVSKETDSNIFNFLDAIASQNKVKALELLYKELKTGRDPYYILTMVIYQFRNLITVKDLQRQKYSELEIAKKAQLHPFVVKKALKSPFQLEKIIPIYSRLFDFDIGFKTGKTNLEDSLYSLAIV